MLLLQAPCCFICPSAGLQDTHPLWEDNGAQSRRYRTEESAVQFVGAFFSYAPLPREDNKRRRALAGLKTRRGRKVSYYFLSMTIFKAIDEQLEAKIKQQ